MAFARAFVHPPIWLRRMPTRWAKRLRALWICVFVLSILAVVVSTMYAVRASYWVQPTIKHFNLDFDVTTDGKLLLGTVPGRVPKVPVSATALAIDGEPVSSDLRVADLARRLDAAGAGPVTITLRLPNGRTQVLTQTRVPKTRRRRKKNIEIGEYGRGSSPVWRPAHHYSPAASFLRSDGPTTR